MSENSSQNSPIPPEEKASEIRRYNSYVFDQDPEYRRELYQDVRTNKILYIDRPPHTLYSTGDTITRKILYMGDTVIENRPGIYRDMSPPFGWVTIPEEDAGSEDTPRGEDIPVSVETTSTQNS